MPTTDPEQPSSPSAAAREVEYAYGSAVRPRLGNRFVLGHGLGNDYLVFTAAENRNGWTASPEAVRRVCDRHCGLGADGIVAVLSTEPAIRLRMFNPDGSEFERSGNGLRIVAAWLAGSGFAAQGRPFDAEVGGGSVGLRAAPAESGQWDVEVEMGRAGLGPEVVAFDRGPVRRTGGSDPTVGARDAAIELEAPTGGFLSVSPVSIGNPHMVVFGEKLSEDVLARIGPWLAAHRRLAAGSNVQLARVVGAGVMRALIWERGVGRTAASGTSAVAVAVAAVARGLQVPGEIRVEMPGGSLFVSVNEELDVRLRGPVEMVAEGRLDRGFLTRLG